MNNYLTAVEMVEYPIDFKVTLAYYWIHPERIPKILIDLGSFKGGFYKMPDFYTNYKYLSGDLLDEPIEVPIIGFKENIFHNNIDISDLVLSCHQQTLPTEAFKGMSNLKRIWIPKNVSYIPKDCFSGCSSLEEIYYEGSEDDFKGIEVYYKRYRVIPRLGIKDDIEAYYDYGNLPFLKAKVYYNQARDIESIKRYYIAYKKKDVTSIVSKIMTNN